MTVASIAAAGMPPAGLGLYARNHVVAGPWRWFAIDAWRSDAAQQVAAARALGADVWMFGGPDRWTPDTWRRSLREAVAAAQAHRASGIIVDRENGWTSSQAHATENQTLGAELRAAAMSTRVGVTSFPGAPHIDVLARATRRLVWGSPQFYARDLPPSQFGAWWSRWRSWWGARLIPSIAAWPASDALGSAVGYDSYLAQLPRAGGYAAWPVHPIPSYMTGALTQRFGGLHGLTMLPFAALGALDTWTGLVLLVLALLVAVSVLVGGAR